MLTGQREQFGRVDMLGSLEKGEATAMQRDMNLVVTILGALRDDPSATLSDEDITQAVQYPGSDPFSHDQVAHHLDLLADAELIKSVQQIGEPGTRWRLTWQGYDTLEGDDDDDDA